MEWVVRLAARYHGPPTTRPSTSTWAGRRSSAPTFTPRNDDPDLEAPRRDPGLHGVPHRKAPKAIAAENIAQLARTSRRGPHRRRRGDRERRRRNEPLPGPGSDALEAAHRRAPRRRPGSHRRLERKLRAAPGRRLRASRGRRRGPSPGRPSRSIRTWRRSRAPERSACRSRTPTSTTWTRCWGRSLQRPRWWSSATRTTRPRPHPDRAHRRVHRSRPRSRLRDPGRGLRRVPAPRRPRGVHRPVAPLGEPGRPSHLLQVLRTRRASRRATPYVGEAASGVRCGAPALQRRRARPGGRRRGDPPSGRRRTARRAHDRRACPRREARTRARPRDAGIHAKVRGSTWSTRARTTSSSAGRGRRRVRPGTPRGGPGHIRVSNGTVSRTSGLSTGLREH